MCRIYFTFFIISCLLIFVQFNQSQAQEQNSKERKEHRKAKKQEKIDKGKMMIMPFAGPAYTPELGFTLAGGILVSFKTNPNDSLIQRSSSPITLGITSTGAYFFGTKLTSFWKEDKLRIYADLNYKNMPDNYWGVGYIEAYTTEKGDSTTAYTRTWWQVYPKFLWQFKKNFFIGPQIDFNYTKGNVASPEVRNDPYYKEYNDKPFNSGLGLVFQYDSRDIPVNAWRGAFAEVAIGIYGPYLGGDNNFQVINVDLRRYWNIHKRRGQTLAVQIRGRFSNGNVPYGEMSQPGSPYDLRGYTWGRYRDESMFYAIGEYRLMFKKRDGSLSPHGIVGWIGLGTLGETVSQFGEWLPNIGIGYRFQVQPRMNVRLDIGFGRETRGFYFNFNEAY